MDEFPVGTDVRIKDWPTAEPYGSAQLKVVYAHENLRCVLITYKNPPSWLDKTEIEVFPVDELVSV